MNETTVDQIKQHDLRAFYSELTKKSISWYHHLFMVYLIFTDTVYIEKQLSDASIIVLTANAKTVRETEYSKIQ